jgi:hypothetical protein
VPFADVKGSMDLAEQVDPKEWHKTWEERCEKRWGIVGENGGNAGQLGERRGVDASAFHLLDH